MIIEIEVEERDDPFDWRDAALIMCRLRMYLEDTLDLKIGTINTVITEEDNES